MVEGARLLSECAANNRTAGSNPALSVFLSSSASSVFARSISSGAAILKEELGEHSPQRCLPPHLRHPRP